MPKSDNLLAVLWLLTSRKRMTAAQLAAELELSVRTVYRYIDALCASGVPIVAEPGHEGGYSLMNHFAEAPLFFSEDERKSIVHAAQFAENAGYPHLEALERALEKIRLFTNKDQLDSLVRHTRGFHVLPSRSNAPAPEAILSRLELAVANSSAVRMDYRKEDGSVTAMRPIDPYGIVHWSGRWYAVAYCRLRGDIRSFRVDRILTLVETGETFERPNPFSAGDYFIKRLLPKKHGPEELITVKIEGKPDAVRRLCVHNLLQNAVVDQSEGGAHFELENPVVQYMLPGLLLSFGRSVRVVEPHSLKEELAALAADLLDYYESDLS